MLILMTQAMILVFHHIVCKVYILNLILSVKYMRFSLIADDDYENNKNFGNVKDRFNHRYTPLHLGKIRQP